MPEDFSKYKVKDEWDQYKVSDVKKNDSSDDSQTSVDQSSPSESVGQESTSKSQSSDGFRTVASPTQKPQVQYENQEPQTLNEQPVIKEGNPLSVPDKPKTKQQQLQEKIDQRTKEKYHGEFKEGTVPYPTPDEKINSLSTAKTELDNKYKDLLITATDQKERDKLIEDYKKELDQDAVKNGLDKVGDKYVVPQVDIDKYNKAREFAVNEVSTEEGDKNKSWLKAAGSKLMAGVNSIDASVASLIGMATRFGNPTGDPNIAQKWADDWAGYFQKEKENYQKKAQEHYDNLDNYVNKGDYLGASGAAALNVIESIPILASFIAGNKAEALTETATLLGIGEGKQKYESIKDLDVPESAKIFNSVGTALNFIALSRIGGGEIANNVKGLVADVGESEAKILLQKSTQNLLQNSIETMYKATSPALKGYAIGWSSSFASNLLDKATIDPERDLTQGNNEAGLTWALMEKASTLAKDVQSVKQDIQVAIGKLPKNIAPEDYARSLDIIMEKDNLTKQNESLDETFQDVNKGRINELKDKVSFITQPRVNKEKINMLNTFVNEELAKDKPNIDKITEVGGELKNIEKVKIPEVEPIDKKIDQLIKERNSIKVETLEGEEKIKGKADIEKLNTEIIGQLKQKQDLKQKFYDETIKGINDPIDQQIYSKEKQQAMDEIKQALPNINLKQIENEKIRNEKTQGEGLLKEGQNAGENGKSLEKGSESQGTVEEEAGRLRIRNDEENRLDTEYPKENQPKEEIVKPEEQKPPVTNSPSKEGSLSTEIKNEPKTSVVDDYKLSGIKKELFEGESTYQKLSTEEWMKKGQEMVDNGQLKPKELIDDINEHPRALNPEEVSGFVYYKAKLDNKYNELYNNIEQAKQKGDVEAEYNSRVEFEGIQKELDNYRTMAVETAYVQGLSFRLRQALLDSVYNLQSQIKKYKEVNNGVISPEVETKFKEYSNKIDELNKKLQDKETELEKVKGNETLGNINKGLKRSPKEKFGKDLIAEGTSELAQALGVIKMAIGETRPEVTKALFKIGKGLIDEGLATAENVIQKIKDYIDENFKDKIKFEDYKNELESSLSDLIGKPEMREGKLYVPPKLVRSLVEKGATDINELTNTILKQVKKDNPDITERQVRDAITNYGREVGMTKDEVQSKINEMNRVGRLISQYEDVLSKNIKRKEKTTTPQTAKEIELKTKIRQSAKDLGIDLTGKTNVDKLTEYKKGLKKSIDIYKERIKNKDYEPAVKKVKPELNKEIFELELQKNQLKEQFDLEYEKARRENRTYTQKARDLIVDAVNLPKSLMASADLSAPLRQGALLSFANPKEASASMREMFRQAFSGKKADRWLAELKTSPEYQFMRQAKLYISEPTARLSAKEESFMTNIAYKIPIWGHIVKGSERAYTGYLNKLRVDVFNQGVDHLVKEGFNKTRDIEVYKSWANFVNNATGRGHLGKLEPIADLMNTAMFSPRLVASRFNLLNPATYIKMPPEVRKMALKNVMSYVGLGSTVLALAYASGASVELDPRSSDFGKIKVGNTRFDIWAGFQQWVRTLTQITLGERKRTSTDEIVKLDPNKYPYESRLSVAGQFVGGKLSPIASLVMDLLGGKGFAGEDLTLTGIIKNETIPLYLQDMTQIYQEEGIGMAFGSMLPGIFGVGTQYYDTAKGTRDKYENTIRDFRKRNDPNNLLDKNYISAYLDIMHKVNKLGQDKELSKLIDAENIDDANKYLAKKNQKQDYVFMLNNSATMDKLSRTIGFLKTLPKEDQKFYANEIQSTIDDMVFAYKNDDTFKLSEDMEALYKLYQNSNELRKKTKEEIRKEL